jgi:hypothetical protein
VARHDGRRHGQHADDGHDEDMKEMMGNMSMMHSMGMMQRMGMMGGGMDGMATIDRVEGRIAFLRAERKISDAQADAWNGFAEALRTNAKKLAEVRASMMPKPGDKQPPASTLSARLDSQEQWLTARLDGLRAMKSAFAKLNEFCRRSEEDGQRSPRPAYGDGNDGNDACADPARTRRSGADAGHGSRMGMGRAKIDPDSLDQAAALAAVPRGNRRAPARHTALRRAFPISGFAHRDQFSISMPVETLLSHRNTRSSNTTLPVAPGANGQPPRPPSDPSSTARAGIERGGGVAIPCRGIVQVNADRLCARDLHGRRRQLADLLRPGITNGVGDRDHVDTGLEQSFR